jgi:hypothetical protein
MKNAAETLAQSFGLSIAFVIPGAIGLYATSFFVPIVAVWFGADAGTTVGGFLFVLLGSAGMGVFISGLRWLVTEKLTKVFKAMPEELDVARRKDPGNEATYQDVLARHYQFFQFYANTPFALALLYLAWVTAGPSPLDLERALWVFFLMILADIVLLLSAHHALGRCEHKLRDILGLRRVA